MPFEIRAIDNVLAFLRSKILEGYEYLTIAPTDFNFEHPERMNFFSSRSEALKETESKDNQNMFPIRGFAAGIAAQYATSMVTEKLWNWENFDMGEFAITRDVSNVIRKRDILENLGEQFEKIGLLDPNLAKIEKQILDGDWMINHRVNATINNLNLSVNATIIRADDNDLYDLKSYTVSAIDNKSIPAPTGIINGIDIGALDRKLAAIDWQTTESIQTPQLIEGRESDFDMGYIGQFLKAMDVLEQTVEGQKQLDLLRLRHWANTPVESLISENSKDFPEYTKQGVFENNELMLTLRDVAMLLFGEQIERQIERNGYPGMIRVYLVQPAPNDMMRVTTSPWEKKSNDQSEDISGENSIGRDASQGRSHR